LAIAVHQVPDERLVVFQGRAGLHRKGGVPAGQGEAGELVEAAAQAGEVAEHGLVRRVSPSFRRGAERRLADEASRREA